MKLLRSIPARIALIYLIAGLAWLLFSDFLFYSYLARYEAFFGTSLIKGVLFISGTAAIILILLKRAENVLLEEVAAKLERENFIELALQSIDGGEWYIKLDPSRPDNVTDNIYISPALKKIVGFTDSDIPNSITKWREYIHPDDIALIDEAARNHLLNNTPSFEVKYRLLDKEGQYHWIQSRGIIERDARNRPVRWAGIDIDATHTIAYQRRLQHLNHILETVRKSNHALIRSEAENELYTKVCENIAASEDYVFSCVLKVTADDFVEPKSVSEGNYCKMESGIIMLTTIFNPEERARLDDGQALVYQGVEILDTSRFGWLDHGAIEAVKSLIILPLIVGAQLDGMVVVAAPTDNAFDDDAIELLEELAQDLAYGLDSLRLRDERDRLSKAQIAQVQREEGLLEGTINAISNAVEKRDPYTSGHQRNVAKLAVGIAREMGLSRERRKGIWLGALIHDLGKINIPAEILNRPGKLSDNEFAIIKGHPEVGYDIIKNVDYPWPIKEMILQHHERMDGSGYPKGLHGEEISLEARIIAVADVVDAITAHRPYRPALGVQMGMEEILEYRAIRYDPDAVDACVKIISDGFQWTDRA